MGIALQRQYIQAETAASIITPPTVTNIPVVWILDTRSAIKTRAKTIVTIGLPAEIGETIKIEKEEDVREIIVDELEKDLIGPRYGSEEILPKDVTPMNTYFAGIYFLKKYQM